MLTEAITDRRAWRADTINHCAQWYWPLSDRCVAALVDATSRLHTISRPITQTRVVDFALADCRDELRGVIETLESGPGFAVIRGLAGSVPREDWTAAYWLVGQLLGEPVEQNVEGTLLYDVRDTGQDVRYGARFSVTNAESSFHTDNSFGEQITDYVGLLCLNTARSGGLSQMVSGIAVHNDLLDRDRRLLAELYAPFHIDRRGGVRPGDDATVRFPVFAWDSRELQLRYLRYWIEAGHEKAAVPLTASQRAALDLVDQVANDRRLQVEFALEPGDMYFINNRWILHNRTAFEDHDVPELRRHLVRLWLRAHHA
jgi:alpha-ketoglutarate-dependent taurine dioxygenase